MYSHVRMGVRKSWLERHRGMLPIRVSGSSEPGREATPERPPAGRGAELWRPLTPCQAWFCARSSPVPRWVGVRGGTVTWRGQYSTETHTLNFPFQNPVSLSHYTKVTDRFLLLYHSPQVADKLITLLYTFLAQHSPIWGIINHYSTLGSLLPPKFQTFCLYFVVSRCENRMLCFWGISRVPSNWHILRKRKQIEQQ